MCIEKNINNLKKYIEEDEIYSKYKNGEYETLSDFELFCVNHCKDIEELLKDYTKQKQMYLYEVDKTTDVTLLYNGLLNKIKNKIEELNNQEKELQNSITEEEREEYEDANISFLLCDIEIRREVLKELLQEGNK